MALQKNPITINFSQGVDSKTDPFQIPLGKFARLVNTQFGEQGRLKKRNGFPLLTKLPNTEQTTLTTLNDNLIATGTDLYAYSQDTDQWLNKGSIQPVNLSTQSLIRSSSSQTSPDATIAPNGLVCSVYMDDGVGYYQVSDSSNGQQIVAKTLLPDDAINPRVFLLGRWFIVTFSAMVSVTPTLQYIAIPYMNPTSPKAATNISANLNSQNTGYDCCSNGDNLYIAWGESGSAVGIAYLSSSLALSGVTNVAGNTADLVSVTIDRDNALVWVAFWEDSSDDGYVLGYNYIMGNLVTKTQIINNMSIAEITSVATDNVLYVYYQVVNNYPYTDSTGDSIRSDYIETLTVTKPITVTTGIVSSTSVVCRSVGLASKVFIADSGTKYMLAVYGDTDQVNSLDNSNQPTYFLINEDGDVCLRLAYSNGGGYASTQVLSNVTALDGEYVIPYLITDFLTTVNKGTALPDGTPVNAIFTQTGVNLAFFDLNTAEQQSSEIARTLHLTGGQLWQFDGVKPVEHGFHVWPENIVVTANQSVSSISAQAYFYVFTYEWTDNQGLYHKSASSIPIQYVVSSAPANFTADTTNTNDELTNVSSFIGLQVGQVISGTGIPVGTYIVSLNSGTNTIVMSNNATATATGVTITPTSISQVTINVPTLRITAKDSTNPVRIVGYRYSEGQQIYYQFTSLTNPTLNDTSVDSVVIVDGNSDAQILGNPLLYTTGGVLENIAPPASVDSALFDNRLFLINAEDRNVLGYSKQVIQNVPVEMSDLLTIYVSPTTGAQGSTGEMTAIFPMDDKLIIFKRSALYYINGNGPDNTGANSSYSQPIFISGTVGTPYKKSIVLMPNGLMFQSDKGIWLLGRDLSTTYIGADVERYTGEGIAISATAIPGTNEVRFVMDTGITLMYDYYYNQWGVHTNVSAISAPLYQGTHTYLNSYGQVLKESVDSYVDGSTPVLISLTTGWINLAGLQGYERFYFGHLLGSYYTPFKLNFQLAYDYNPSATQSIIITPDNYTPNWGDESVWGGGQAWGGPGNVFEARVFPQQQKCESFQVTIDEIYDPTLNVPPGQGLALSGLTLTVGMKRGFRTQKAKQSFG